MITGTTGIAYRVPSARASANAIRRRVWRWLFAPNQVSLSPFFLDPGDLIGAERIKTGGVYEEPALAVLEQLIRALGLGQGSVLDVGANIGNHSCWFAERFTHVVCVEPSDIAFSVLRANILARGFRNATPYQCALGASEGKGTIRCVDSTNIGANQVVNRPQGDIEILAGDTLWRRVGPIAGRLELVKIDVEGSELDVVAGLRGALATFHPLLCVEVLNAARWDKLKSMITELGYTNWAVIVPRPGYSGIWNRLRGALAGREYRLEKLESDFDPDGYQMVFCLTPKQTVLLSSQASL